MTPEIKAEGTENGATPPVVHGDLTAIDTSIDDTGFVEAALPNEATPGAPLAPSEAADDEPEEHEQHVMSVIEHLEELRTCIIRSIFFVLAGLSIGLIFGKQILVFLKAPAGNITFQALSLEEPILVYLKVSFYGGLIIASPFILNEICRFISPGLTARERKVVMPAIVASPLLFVSGAAFAYYAVLPTMLHFFASFGEGVIQVNQRLDFYVSLVSSFLMYMGLCFQLPLIICALSFTGLIGSHHLIKFWRYAFFGAGVVAAVVTPDPTAFSMLVTMAALIALYGLSIILVKFFGR